MRRPFAIAALLVCTQSSLHAQSLSQRFRQLFVFGDCGQPLCLDVGPAHGLHFIPSVTQGEHDLFSFVTGSISTSLASLPFTAANSGAEVEMVDGKLVLTPSSAGSIFAEQATTLGRGRLLAGANVNQIVFRNIRGVDLRDLTLRFAHQNVQGGALGDPSYELDLIEVSTSLHLDFLVTSVYASYGLFDNIDVGILVPLVRANLEGASVAHVLPFADPSPHFFAAGGRPSDFAEATSSGSSLGVGDVAVRVKAHLLNTSGIDIGVFGDARLPTGDSANFLGSGQTSVRVLGILSGKIGNFSPHINAGYAYRSGSNQTNSIVGVLGFDQLIAERVTLAVDILSDLQLGASSLTLPEPVIFEPPSAPSRRVRLTNIPEEDKDNLVDASIGLKTQLRGDYRIITNLLLPLSDGGLRSRYFWTVGFERTF